MAKWINDQIKRKKQEIKAHLRVVVKYEAECINCGELYVTATYGQDEFTEMLYKEGWRAEFEIETGKIGLRCPECIKKILAEKRNKE